MNKNSSENKQIVSSRGVLVTVTDISLLFIAVSALNCLLYFFSPVIGISAEAVFLICYLLCVFYFVPLYYNRLLYSADRHSINVKRGLIIHRYTRIAVNDIQYCKISQGLIQKLYRSCSVYIMLTGSFTIISNISPEDAEMIMELSVPEIKDKSGEINEEGR